MQHVAPLVVAVTNPKSLFIPQGGIPLRQRWEGVECGVTVFDRYVHTEKNTIQILTDQQLLIEMYNIASDLMKL